MKLLNNQLGIKVCLSRISHEILLQIDRFVLIVKSGFMDCESPSSKISAISRKIIPHISSLNILLLAERGNVKHIQ